MKTLDLLRTLSRKERKEFELVMKNHKRMSLKKLYFFLKPYQKKEKSPPKAAAFEATFDKSYTSKKDYKLRHELRLLNEELTHFLAVKQFEAQLKDNSHFSHTWEMKMLESRKLHKHLETAYKQYFEKAKEEFQPQLAQEMLNIHINNLIAHREIRLEMYQELIELLEQKKDLLEQEAMHKVRETNVKQAFATRVIRIMQPDFPSPSIQNPLIIEQKGAYSEILTLEAQAYLQNGLEKITTLTKLLQQLEHCNYPWLQYNRRKMAALTNIALTYYMMSSNELAHQYYEQAIEQAKSSKQSIPIELLFNYFSNLVKMEYYFKALEVYHENESIIEAHPKVANRFLCLKIMCHVFLQQTEDGLQSVPSNIRQLPPDQYYYFRFIQLILLYQNDDWEGGLRETENFLKVLNYVKKPYFDVDYKQLAHFYLDFFKAVSDTAMAQKKLFNQLQAELIACKNVKSAHNDHLLLMWLGKEVERLIDSLR